RANHEFQIALRWQVGQGPANFDQIAQRVRAEAEDLCGAGSGPAPPYIVASAPPAPAAAGGGYVRYFPPRALEQHVSGVSYLCCTARPDRALACRVALEQPSGYGFAEATMNAARGFRLSDEKFNQVQASPTHVLPVAIEWDSPPAPAD